MQHFAKAKNMLLKQNFLIFLHIALLLSLTACGQRPQRMNSDQSLKLNDHDVLQNIQPSTPIEKQPNLQARFVNTPRPAKATKLTIEQPSVPSIPDTAEPIDILFESLPLPAFINEVYGNLLKRSFVIDSNLKKQEDLVTLRTAAPLAPHALDLLSRKVLKSYGVSIVKQGDLLRFTINNDSVGESPLLYSGRALPEVPETHRPIFQLMPLVAVRNTQVRGWLSEAFKGMQLKIMEDSDRNALILQGPPEIVRQAIAAVKMFDQPTMRGRESVRIEPVNIDPQSLAELLVNVLNSEGYTASIKPPMGSIIILPVQEINAVLVFAAEKKILDHIMAWAKNIDQPGRQSGNKRLFNYTVRNTSAIDLGALINNVLAGGLLTQDTNSKKKKGQPTTSAKNSKQIIVDPASNSLIFQGKATEWEEILSLIRKKDKPVSQVLVEVTIAEITLFEQEEFGVEWMNAWDLGDFAGTISTFGGLGIGSAGFTGTLLESPGGTRAMLNAFASDNRVNILSTPRIMVKNGMEASIDVGTDVPIITSQQARSDLSTGGDTGILQTIQYRKTGILLSVKPVIYSNNRVDLEVSQEVSEVSSGKESSVQSPSILTRSIKTSISLTNGGAVVLGGLIRTSSTTDTAGIPLLMDIPWLGSLFSVDNISTRRTELIMIIVPYIVDSYEGARAVTDALKEQMKMK